MKCLKKMEMPTDLMGVDKGLPDQDPGMESGLLTGHQGPGQHYPCAGGH